MFASLLDLLPQSLIEFSDEKQEDTTEALYVKDHLPHHNISRIRGIAWDVQDALRRANHYLTNAGEILGRGIVLLGDPAA